MARTQARRKPARQSKPASRNSNHSFLILCVGIAIGLVIPKGIELAKSRLQGMDVLRTDQSTEQLQQHEQPITPQFDFYTLLPDTEVVVPDEEFELRPGLELVELDTANAGADGEGDAVDNSDPSTVQNPMAEGTADSSASNTVATETYVLQAGSFRGAGDAESVKVRLLLLNLPADVQEVDSSNGVWHRVLVGPYSDTASMSSARAVLQANSIDSIVLRQSSN